MPVPFGFLCLDKPLLDTSHDLVYQVRRGTRIKRIGHAGTLDPLATGVLVLAIGAATRLIEYVMASQKTYLATIRLGQQTPSYDAETQVIATAEIHHLTERDIQAALKHFEGEVEQIPPMHSAVWHNGQRLYDLARRGEVVEREARRVWMQPRLISYHPPDAHIEVICSPGTYIRTLAHDLGRYSVSAHIWRLCGAPLVADSQIRWRGPISTMRWKKALGRATCAQNARHCQRCQKFTSMPIRPSRMCMAIRSACQRAWQKIRYAASMLPMVGSLPFRAFATVGCCRKRSFRQR